MRILLNAVSVKMHGGGVFQIATNFIMKAVEQYSDEIEWFFVVSEDLNQNFQQYSFSKENNYFVFPTQPDFKGSYFKVRKSLKQLEELIKPQVVYSIASPSYFSFNAPEVMRFANAWVTNPNRYALKTHNFKKRIRYILNSSNIKRELRKRKYFITQSNTVKGGILSVVKTDEENVKVISNVLPALFLDQKKTIVFNKQNNEGVIYIACVAAPMGHKNLDILPEVLKILRDKHCITNTVFLTTIPETSNFLKRLNQELSSMNLMTNVINYGYCTQEKLIDLYSKCEICFMPTLLETFSATLLEAMFFNLAIVTSEFSFNQEVVEDSALYFKPMDAEDAADKLATLLKDKPLRDKLKREMSQYLENYSSYDKHMLETIDFLKKIAEKHRSQN